MRKGIDSQNGFSLIECVFALIITMVGVLAVAALIVIGIRLQVESRDATEAGALARTKVEELHNFSPTSAQRTPGGSVTANVANYNDTVDTRFRRRWLIEAGGTIPANTQRITIAVVPNRPDVRLPVVRVVTLIPAS